MDDTPLARFHRQRRRELVLRRVPLALLAVAAGGAMSWVFVTQPSNGPAASAVAPATHEASAGAPSGTLLAGPAPEVATPDPPPDADPRDLPPDAAPSDAAPGGAASDPAPRAQQSFSIAVATRGFQTELDRCEWVRMDVGAVAPIVGAHNFCDGDVVLAMNVGDLVAVTGTDLDGDYQVTGSRDAHAGDDAAAATSGLTADLLLQTCYWTGGALRLVTLRRVDLSLPPTPAPSG
jgi:hypothetical protein